jgi:hypothetical protein
MSGVIPSDSLLVGHTSRQMRPPARRFTNVGSSMLRTPCWMRRAPSSSMAAVTLAGPASSPACGALINQPGLASDRESAAKWRRRVTTFLTDEAEGDHATACPLGGQPSHGLRVAGRRSPIGDHQHAEADAGGARRGGASVEHEVKNGGFGPDYVAAGSGQDCGFDPGRSVGRGVLDHLVHQTVHVVRPAKEADQRSVGVDERREGGVPTLDGQCATGALGQLPRGFSAHGALEVHVEVRLRKRA